MTDPKIDFYWHNRAQIEEWAALRGTAADVLVEELRGQADRLQELSASTTDLRVVETHDPALVALTRPSWVERGIELQVALGWNRSTLLAATGTNRPFVGIRVSLDEDRRRPFVDHVRGSAGSELRRLGWTNVVQKTWPAWVYMEPDENQDIPTFASACGNEVMEGWRALAPHLDAAVQRLTDA